jgi:hypothetical protein
VSARGWRTVEDMPPMESATREQALAPSAEVNLPDEPVADTWRDAAEIGDEAAQAAWAEAARTVLVGVAQQYHALITNKELAAEVQRLTEIRTSRRTHYWMADVLARVSRDGFNRGEPLLSALCVNPQGSMADGYAAAVAATTGAATDDVDGQAALERLACYRHFHAAGLPDDGGAAALTPQVVARRARARKEAAANAPIDVCPTCHTQLPATKVCDNYCT